jgi:hypothetical protein
MSGQPGFFDSDERLKALSAAGDPLERLAEVVDFEVFRKDLERALSRSDRAKGGRPPYDAVLMFKVLPRGRKMPTHIARGNATRARVRSRVEHVFAAQKCRLGLVVRTVGMVRARVKIGLANLAYNFTRLAWLNGRAVPA